MWGGRNYSHLTDKEASKGPGVALATWQWVDEGLQTEHPVSVPPAPLPALLLVLPQLPSQDLDPHHGPLVGEVVSSRCTQAQSNVASVQEG